MLWVLALMTLVLGGASCATSSDSENLSSRPWNTPKSWEHGMPTQMFEGR